MVVKIFCIANQKGGVGKTTTAVNLAAGLATHKKSVLLIDIDPQGNATTGSGIDKTSLNLSVCDVLMGQVSIQQARQTVEQVGYDVLPSNRELAGVDIELISQPEREYKLKQAIEQLDKDYDFILIDCPPTLSVLTLNGLACAQAVIIPMQCEYFALEGVSDLVNTIKRVHSHINPHLTQIYLLRVMFDPRMTLQQDVSDQLDQYFGESVFKTIIPRNVRLAEAPSYGLPGIIYDKSSRGAQAYLQLSEEVLKRVKKG